MILRITPSFSFSSLYIRFLIDFLSSLSLHSSLRVTSSSIFFSSFHIFFSKVFGFVTEASDFDMDTFTLFEVSELEEELEDDDEEEDEDELVELSRARRDLDLFFFFFLFFSLSSVSLSFVFSFFSFFPFFFLRFDFGCLSELSFALVSVAPCFFLKHALSQCVSVSQVEQ